MCVIHALTDLLECHCLSAPRLVVSNAIDLHSESWLTMRALLTDFRKQQRPSSALSIACSWTAEKLQDLPFHKMRPSHETDNTKMTLTSMMSYPQNSEPPKGVPARQ